MKNMIFNRKLPIPKEIKESILFPLELQKIKDINDSEIDNILLGKDNRILIIIGPCSADNPHAVLEYGLKIKELQDKYNDKIKFVLRCYTAKPRTRGDGYMGLLHQPDPLGNVDLLNGLIACRKLFIELIEKTNLALADELLYPENYRYFSDVLSYVSVGARSVLDQDHRLVSSGLSIPVGLKNSVSGNIEDSINALYSARNPHQFLYRGWEVNTLGNKMSHLILRGIFTNDNVHIPNYKLNDVIKLDERLKEEGLESPIIIDCNHSNSGKDFKKQIDIAKEIINLKKSDNEYNRLVKGIMIESYLLDGKCEHGKYEYGKSITDECLGIDKTIELIDWIYKNY